MSFIGHMHIPHLPHGDPWHRHEINKHLRGGVGKGGGLTKIEFRIAVGFLVAAGLGVLFLLFS